MIIGFGEGEFAIKSFHGHLLTSGTPSARLVYLWKIPVLPRVVAFVGMQL